MNQQKTGENYIVRSYITCVPHQISLEQTSQEDEMGRACSVHGREYRVWWGNLKEGNH
jgi:hypothetical protein